MDKIKILFMGTPEFSVNILNGLIENYDVVGVVTQPDKEVGRHHEIKFSPVKEVALQNNIQVFQPNKIRNEYLDLLKLDVDMIVTCAYGQIIPKELLDFPKYGCINVHASLLPKLRGGAPIHKSIIYGYPETGVTIMYMAEKMDAGDIITQVSTKIEDTDTVGTLHDRLSIMGTNLLLETIPKIISNDIERIPQNENEVTFAWNISREEEKIDFSKTSREIFNQIRGLNPFPGSYTILDDNIVKVYSSYIKDNEFKDKQIGEIVEILKDGFGVKTANGEIVITEIQVSGKKRMQVKDYFNGIDKNSLLGKLLK